LDIGFSFCVPFFSLGWELGQRHWNEPPAERWFVIAHDFDEASWMTKRRSGDGFLRCSDGHIRWGIFGAAGAVFVQRQSDPEAGPLVLLQKRSAMSHEGGTWSCAGGALDEGETPYEGGLREVSEEIGEVPQDHRILGEYAFIPATDWTYTTLVIEVSEQFGSSLNFETDDVGWIDLLAVEQLPLHAGFIAAWPHLRKIIEETAR
jgi:8-oxo-dGTP diphosphatase